MLFALDKNEFMIYNTFEVEKKENYIYLAIGGCE